MVEQSELVAYKEKFLRYLRSEKQRSNKTIENYSRYLERFLQFSHARAPKDITETTIQEYTKWLGSAISSKNAHTVALVRLKNTTQNYHLSALRTFLAFLNYQSATACEPKAVHLKQVTPHVPKTPSEHELASLLQAPQGNDLKTLRDRAILYVLLSTGMRVSELCALSVDIDTAQEEIIVQGTNGKERVVYLSPQAREALSMYLHARNDTSTALFVNNGKRVSLEGDMRLSARSVQRIVSQYAKQVGIQTQITPQRLRNAFTADLLSRGADHGSIKALLGCETASPLLLRKGAQS